MTLLLAVSSILSRLLGVYRNFLLASFFGASALSDAYFAAFQIPDSIYRLFIFGAISASFVPLFLQLKKHQEEKAWQFTSVLLNGLLVVLLVLSFFLFIGADQLVSFFYPSFDESLQDTTARLLRIMLISPFFFTVSSVLSSVQNAYRRLFGFALAPVVYNLGIIFGIIFLSPRFGIDGVAYGVLLGAFFHTAVQFFPTKRLGFCWQPILRWTAEIKKSITMAIPRMMALFGAQVMFVIEGIIASSLQKGDLTVLRFAQDMQSFPIGVIGVSMAISSFSIVSHFALDDKKMDLSIYLKNKLEHLFFLLIPASFGLIMLSIPLTIVFFPESAFHSFSQELIVSYTLMVLGLGIVPAALLPLLMRVFFAFHDSRSPFLITLFSLALNIILALILSSNQGAFSVIGIGLASSIASFVTLLLLFLVLKIRYLSSFSFFPWKRSVLFLFSASIMTLLLFFLVPSYTGKEPFFILLAETLFFILLGIIAYFSIVFLFLKKELFRFVRTFND